MRTKGRKVESKAVCNIVPLACLGGQRRTYAAIDQPFRDHMHHHYVIGRVHAGTRRLVCNDEVFTLEPDDLFIFNPDAVHGCEKKTYQHFAYDSITIAPELLEGAVLTSPVVRDVELRRLFDELIEAIEAHAADEEIRSRALQLASALEVDAEGGEGGEDGEGEGGAEQPETQPETQPAHREAALRVFAHMKGNLSQPLSVAELAHQEGLSEFALIRAYRAQFAITPLQHLHALRVECACELLALGVAPADVAAEVGFSDQAHLTRMFKERMGVTPAAYRKMATQACGADPQCRRAVDEVVR